MSRSRRPLIAPAAGDVGLFIQHDRPNQRVPIVVEFVYRRGDYVVRTKGGQSCRIDAQGRSRSWEGTAHVPYDSERDEVVAFLSDEGGPE